jgi:predicted transcriptional regulator of viral defense system
MKATDALHEILRLDTPVIETRDVAARLGISTSRASQILRSFSESGLAVQLRQGLWTTRENLDPFVLPPYLTAPFPSYVSFWSALARHGMIEQLPRQVFVASLGKPRRLTTSIGTYSIHHLAPKLFGGFKGSEEVGYLATPEKALFDSVYLRASRGGPIQTSELELPRKFRRKELGRWTKEISSPRLRTLVTRGLEMVLEKAREADT